MPVRNRDSLAIRAPRAAADREAAIDLASKVFRHPYFVYRDYCLNEYFDPRDYDADASRIGVIDGQVVTHWGVWRQRMRVGRVAWLVAGVGAVATHADFRGRGLLARTAHAAIDAWIAEGRYDATMLFGIPGFYHRFGYVKSFTQIDYIVNSGELSAAVPGTASPEKVGLEARPELDGLYNRQYAEATGTALRPFLFNRPPGSHDAVARAQSHDGWHAWKHVGRQRVGWAGYLAVTFADHRMKVLEAAGDVEETLAAAGELARRRGCMEIHFTGLPPASGLARALRRRNVTETRIHVDNSGPMGRSLRLASMLGKLLPELTARLKRIRPDAPEGPLLTLTDPRERVTLARRGGRVVVAEAGPARGKGAPKPAGVHVSAGEATFQLLLGAAAPEETLDQAGVRVDPEALRWLNTLFPDRQPQTPPLDKY